MKGSEVQAKERKSYITEKYLRPVLEQAIYERFECPLEEFPPESLKKILVHLDPKGRTPQRVVVGQLRMIPNRRMVVLTIEQDRKAGVYKCVPVHHYTRLSGPDEVIIAPDLYAETWLPCLVPQSVLEEAKYLGTIQRALLLDVQKKTRGVCVTPKGFVMKGAMAAFRALEIQAVLGTSIIQLLDENFEPAQFDELILKTG